MAIFLLTPDTFDNDELEWLKQRAIQRQKEYDRAKELCDASVPAGANPCATLSRLIDHALKCIELYDAWDKRWLPGRHDTKIDDWKRREKELKEKHRRDCTTKC